MRKKYKQLTKAKRLQLEALNQAGLSKRKIADQLGVHISTIYRELKRGEYEHLNTDYTTTISYSSDLSQKKHDENMKAKGGELKIGKNIALADYIEHKIIDDKFSPGAVSGTLKNGEVDFNITLSKQTIYSYIEKGIFRNLTNKDLPVKRNKKHTNYNKVQKRKNAGTSIEDRPAEIDTREDFGNWEMDTVVGKQGVSKQSLLVLTERKTRSEIVRLLPQHTAQAVVSALDGIELDMGFNMFHRIFKTITVDNGTEFSDAEGIARSITKNKPRVDVYYCHPYSSYERGTNEVTNKLIRRHVPKGTDMDYLTPEHVQKIEDWINAYPREMFGWRSSADLYKEEIRKLA